MRYTGNFGILLIPLPFLHFAVLTQHDFFDSTSTDLMTEQEENTAVQGVFPTFFTIEYCIYLHKGTYMTLDKSQLLALVVYFFKRL